MSKKHAITDVRELAKAAGASDEFVDKLSAHLGERCLVNHLLALRGAQGLSQQDIATRMKCSQSRISKFENSGDDDIRIGDLRQYTDALGLNLGIFLADKKLGIVGRIKVHLQGIRDELARLVDWAKDDQAMANSTAKAIADVIYDMVRAIASAAEKLPNRAEDDKPLLQVEMRVIRDLRETEKSAPRTKNRISAATHRATPA